MQQDVKKIMQKDEMTTRKRGGIHKEAKQNKKKKRKNDKRERNK